MEETPYALSTLTTDAHSGSGTRSSAANNNTNPTPQQHTCNRRLSWASAANVTSGVLHAIPVTSSSVLRGGPTPIAYHHVTCDLPLSTTSPLHDPPSASASAAAVSSSPGSGIIDDEDDDADAESVDLLRMLPDSQRPKEINPRRTRCAYLQRDDDEGEASGGGCDDGVLFYNSLRCASEYSNREQEERIAFLSRSYSTLDKTKRNNGTPAAAGLNTTGIYSDMENSTRSANVAEYCTSKAHSRSCGSLTYPPAQRAVDKNRSTRNVYTDSNGLKHKRLKRVKRCVFLGAIFLGIVLATTGIIVAFLVYAPFHMKAHSCRNGYIFCGKAGCVTPRRLCGSKLQCPGVKTEMLCHGNNVSGWVYFQGGSSNGSRYITVHRAMTFYGAQESCRDQGGHLAHVNTVREQVFLEDYLNQIYKRHRFPSDMLGFWVGARRARGSHAGSCLYNQWQWMDTYGRAHGTVTGFTAFANGKPDNFFAPEECLYLSTTHSHDESRYLKWDDAPCDIHGIGTIYAACEVELR